MKKRKAILKQIKALDKEVSSRVSEVSGERGLYAAPEEVEALRQLAGCWSCCSGRYQWLISTNKLPACCGAYGHLPDVH
jgi:hypothetical protein